MAFVPKFRLYSSDGLSLLYTFPGVFSTNAPQSAEEVIELTNIRSKGSLFIGGGDTAWDLSIEFNLVAENYEAIVVLMDALETAMAFNTPYIFRYDKTISTFYNYKVKRVRPFVYPKSLRNKKQQVNAIFKVNSW